MRLLKVGSTLFSIISRQEKALTEKQSLTLFVIPAKAGTQF
jgi:hypothetical protein